MALSDIPYDNYVQEKDLAGALPAMKVMVVSMTNVRDPRNKARAFLVGWSRHGGQLYLMPDGHVGRLIGWVPDYVEG